MTEAYETSSVYLKAFLPVEIQSTDQTLLSLFQEFLGFVTKQ